MARNVTTPRFWVNYMQFFEHMNSSLITNEIDDIDRSKFHTLPVDVSFFGSIGDSATSYDVDFSSIDSNILNNPFIAILGWERFAADYETKIILSDSNNTEITSTSGVSINSDFTDEGWTLYELDSYDIAKLSAYQVDSQYFPAKIGSVVLGSWWEPPHSPDLSLTLSYDYSGIKKQTTRGGNTLTNTLWNRPPKWGTKGAWEIERGQAHNLARTGRRSWNLKFSFFSESNIFPTSTNLATGDENYPFDETLLTGTSNDLYGKLLIPTVGGTLPFLFSPSNSTDDLASYDNYAICTISKNSFQFKQVANQIYDISFVISETW